MSSQETMVALEEGATHGLWIASSSRRKDGAVTGSQAPTLNRRRARTSAAVMVLLVAMVLGTKVISGSAAQNTIPGTFSPAGFAQEQFTSKIVPDIERRSADLVQVTIAIKGDPATAAEKFDAVKGSAAPVFSVKFTGTAGKSDGSGLMPVDVKGMPSGTSVLVQMGPAINGTAVRDATGQVKFSDFKNQVDYQNVGVELNNQVKELVLSKVDAAALAGRAITVTGAFELINPAAFIVTPVKITEEN